MSLGWDLYLSTGILLLVTAAYTVTGKDYNTVEMLELHLLWDILPDSF